MSIENWFPWIALGIGVVVGLTIGAVRLAEYRRNLRVHLDATTDVLTVMAETGETTVSITGALDAFNSIRKDCL